MTNNSNNTFSKKNIKLTTKDDLEMFKAYLNAEKANWLK